MVALTPMLLGSAATAGGAAATAGLFGSAGSFSLLSTLGTLSSVGSMFFQNSADTSASRAEQLSIRTNADIDAANAAKEKSRLLRESYLRRGSQIAASASLGGSGVSAIDVMADTATQEELAILGLKQSSEINQSLASSRSKSISTSSRLNSYAGILSGANKLLSSY